MHVQHKVIITGTGRAGTTFLVQLLTALGLPTGYSGETWRRDYFAHCAAGLEHRITDPNSPYIVKDPELCVTLADVLERGDIVIDHAIVPIRDLAAATSSRVRIGGANGDVPGGLIGTDTPDRQRTILAERFHQLVHTLTRHDIPHTFLLFPRFVEDAGYAYAKLRPVLPAAVGRAEFDNAFHRVANPALIHQFSPGEKPVPAEPAAAFRASQQQKRRGRRTRRIFAWSAVAAGLALSIGFRWPDINTPGPPRSSALRAPMRPPTPRPEAAAPRALPSVANPSVNAIPAPAVTSRPVSPTPLAEAARPGAQTFTSPSGAPDAPAAAGSSRIPGVD